MASPSEVLLISALINNGDIKQAALFGIDPEMFVGYQAEYRWAISYQQTYGHAPSKEALLTKFDDFPFCDASDVAFAADEVRQLYGQRGLRTAVRTAAVAISESDFVGAEMALGAYTPLTAVRPPTNALYDNSFLDGYDTKPDAIAVPWRIAQILTGGMRAGDLWYLAARLGQGKTWGGLDLAAGALCEGRGVNLYSLEMSREQVLTRLHVVLGHRLGVPVDHKAMRDRTMSAREYRQLVGRIREEVPGEIYIYDASDGPCTPAVVGARAKDGDLSVIDYVGLMGAAGGRRAVEDWRLWAAISNELKLVAGGNNHRILALAQINREGDSSGKNTRRPPKVVNLAGTDSLGQDGDVVITHVQYAKNAMVWSLEKNRHGAAGDLFYTRFLPNEGAFSDISKDIADELRDQEDRAA